LLSFFVPFKLSESSHLCEILIIFIKLFWFPHNFLFYGGLYNHFKGVFSYVPISRAAELEVYFTVHVSTESVYKASLLLHGIRSYYKRLWVSIGAEDRHAWLTWLPFRFTGSPLRDSEEERTQEKVTVQRVVLLFWPVCFFVCFPCLFTLLHEDKVNVSFGKAAS